MATILISSKSFNKESKELDKLKDYEIITDYVNDVNIVGIIAGTEEHNLNNYSNLKVISRYGVGLDNIDLEECKKRNILVYNTPYTPSNSVAELTILLILQLLRKDKHLLIGKTVGIIGCGNIGGAVHNLLNCFRVRSLIHDIEYGKYSTPITNLLKESDIVTLHIPLTKDNYHFINREKIKHMKKNAYLINTSRKDIVDEFAVYDALNTGRIAGFASDVNKIGLFKNFKNAILTPHIGSDTIECREQMERETVNNLLEGLNEPEI